MTAPNGQLSKNGGSVACQSSARTADLVARQSSARTAALWHVKAQQERRTCMVAYQSSAKAADLVACQSSARTAALWHVKAQQERGLGGLSKLGKTGRLGGLSKLSKNGGLGGLSKLSKNGGLGDGPKTTGAITSASNRNHSQRTLHQESSTVMILPQVHLRKPCYDFYFL